MLLSSHIADQIVSQLSKVIEPHINIMDINGIIVSSTNPERIGTLHGGAVRILKEKLQELMIERDDEYPGSRNGINLPIEFKNNMIGVIGLTGKSDEVYRYGQIIKKMTEVLLLDISVRQQKQIEQKAKDRFLEEWIFGRYDLIHPVEFIERAKMLDIDVSTSKRIMVFAIRTKDNQQLSDQILTDMSHRLRNLLSKIPQANLFRTSTLFIGVMNSISDDEILKIAKKIEYVITNDFDASIQIGISNQHELSIRNAFKHANLAFQVSLKSKYSVNIYDALNFEIFINTMMTSHKKDYLNRLFLNLSDKEIKSYIDMLRVLYSFEGSINETSKHLFIHKNTLQYRLNRLTEITGYDPRKMSTAYLYNIAIKVYDMLAQEL